MRLLLIGILFISSGASAEKPDERAPSLATLLRWTESENLDMRRLGWVLLRTRATESKDVTEKRALVSRLSRRLEATDTADAWNLLATLLSSGRTEASSDETSDAVRALNAIQRSVASERATSWDDRLLLDTVLARWSRQEVPGSEPRAYVQRYQDLDALTPSSFLRAMLTPGALPTRTERSAAVQACVDKPAVTGFGKLVQRACNVTSSRERSASYPEPLVLPEVEAPAEGAWPMGIDVCSGPWVTVRYKKCRDRSHGVERFQERRDPRCGVAEWTTVNVKPKRYNAVRHADNGVEKVVKRPEKTIVHRNPMRGPVRIDFSLKKYCEDWFKTELKRDGAFVPLELVESKWDGGPVCTASVGEEIYKLAPHSSGGVAEWETRSEPKTFLSCRHSVFGVETYRESRSAACGEEQESLSTVGIPRATLWAPIDPKDSRLLDVRRAVRWLESENAVKTVACSSCDDVDARTGLGRTRRFECLSQRVERWRKEPLSATEEHARSWILAAVQTVVDRDVPEGEATRDRTQALVQTHGKILSEKSLDAVLKKAPEKSSAPSDLWVSWAEASPTDRTRIVRGLLRTLLSDAARVSSPARIWWLRALVAAPETVAEDDVAPLRRICEDRSFVSLDSAASACHAAATVVLRQSRLASEQGRPWRAADAIEGVLDLTLETRIGALSKVPSSRFDAETIEILASIGEWSRRAVVNKSSASAYQDRFSRLLGSVWLALSKHRSSALVEAKEWSATGLIDASEKFLRLALEVKPRLPANVLLPVLGEALSPLSRRLDTAAAVRDFSCRVQRCDQEKTDSRVWGDVGRTYVVLATLGEATKRRDSAGAVENLSLRNLLLLLEKHGDDIRSAVAEMLGKRDLRRLSLHSVAPIARPFFQIVQQAAERESSFRRTGLFLGSPPKELAFGLHREVLEAIKNEGAALRTALTKSAESFRQERLALAQAAVGAEEANTQLERLRGQFAVERIRAIELQADLEGLRASRRAKEQRFSEYWREANAAVDAVQKHLGEGLHWSEKRDSFVIAADEARFETEAGFFAPPSRIDTVARGAGAWLTLAKDEQLDVEVTGQWSPSCAVGKYFRARVVAAKEHLAKPTVPGAVEATWEQLQSGGFVLRAAKPSELNDLSVNDYVVREHRGLAAADLQALADKLQSKAQSLEGLRVGPEGFGIAVTANDQFSRQAEIASRLSDSRRSDACRSKEEHIGGSFGLNFIISIPLGGTSASKTEADCAARGISDESGIGRVGVRSEGSMATLGGGLLLPEFTPLRLPAGSLVLVAMPRGETSFEKRLDAWVVGSQSTFTFRHLGVAEVDLYLVANDCRRPSRGADEPKLQVRFSRRSPATPEAKTLIGAMAAATEVVDRSAREVLARGEYATEGIAALRTKVDSVLDEKDRLALEKVPTLRAMLDRWFVREAEQLALASQLALGQRKLAAQLATLRDLSDELVRREATQRVRERMRAWALEGVEPSLLSDSLARLLRHANVSLLPVLEFQYADVLQRAVEDEKVAARLRQLTAVGVHSELTEMADWVGATVGALESEVRIRGDLLPDWDKTTLFLGFPNPDCPGVGQEDHYHWEHCRNGTAEEQRKQAWHIGPIADLARSRALWKALEKGETAKVTVTPRDLYADVTLGRLTDRQATPVIAAMGVYLLVDPRLKPALENKGGDILPVIVGPELEFPGDAGVDLYRLVSARWASSVLPVGFGQVQNGSDFALDGATAARGLSPFATHEIQLKPLTRLLDAVAPRWRGSVREIRFVFRVQTRRTEKAISVSGLR